MWRRIIIVVLLTTFATSCTRVSREIEPVIALPLHPKEIQREHRGFLSLPADFSLPPFSPLNEEEKGCDWGKEYHIALCFAADFDLFRAITGFKRALCLIPIECAERRMELEYCITLAYFLGQKYVEVIYSVESTTLLCADETFPAFGDLLLILYDSYDHLGRCEHAAHIFNLIEQRNPCQARKLTLLSAVKRADFGTLCAMAQAEPERAYIGRILNGYHKKEKSVRKAQILNGILPGAGYWYVGLKQTATTAFLINTLFIAAATHFIVKGNGAAGLITLSLESGWYFGGITGAGLAAREYNEQLYSSFAEKITQKESYFPLMMLNYTF